MAASSEVDEKNNSKEMKVQTAGIKLSELKIQDLKAELEKRDLEKIGVKSVLLERLKNALIEEGEDPEKFIFEIKNESSMSKKTTVTKNNNSIKTNGDPSVKDNDESESKDDMSDSIEFDVKDEVIDDICDEIKDTSDIINNSEENDKSNLHEVTLQLSIDEEDAQLNDEENLLEMPKSIENEEEKKLMKKSTSKSNDENVAIKSESSKSKQAKPANDDKKENKKISQIAKSEETSAVISPKILKALGKSDKIKNLGTLAKSLWITGLPSTTRAADLKALFSKQGRVLSVKIVKSTKQTPGKCYGFVTMASSKDASKAIQNLHRIELNGRTISVERTQNEPSVLLKKSESKVASVSSKKQPVKKEASVTKVIVSSKSSVTSDKKVSKQDSKVETKSTESVTKHKSKKDVSEKIKLRERERKSHSSRDRSSRRLPDRRPPIERSRPYSFHERSRFGASRRVFAPRPFRGRSIRPGYMSMRSSRPINTAYSFQRIREERFRLRAERERERKRLEEITRHRFIEKKQREEAYRLEREKEKLRLEREMLERERAEIIKLEREKQRLERERLIRERDELRRQAELRRAKRPASHLPERESEQYWDSRKKIPRYEARASYSTEPSTSSRYDYPVKEKPVLARHDFERRTERYSKPVAPPPRVNYEDRDSRREVTIRPREERQVYDRSVYRADRDSRPSYQDRERHSSKREAPRMDWKHDRRVQERIVPSSSNSSTARRMYYS